MSPSRDKISVYLEIGSKRVFACALDWPGWARSGRDEESALAALIAYGPRYERVARAAKLGFEPPKDLQDLKLTERVKGGTTTDFGAPDTILAGDVRPIEASELKQFEALFKACWKAFDHAAQNAAGKTLSKGPRGGGRDLQKILDHLNESDLGYLSAIGWKISFDRDRKRGLEQTRESILEALRSVGPVGQPEPGPRGGKRWPARYFVRRTVWHLLDHVWEIEDRA